MDSRRNFIKWLNNTFWAVVASIFMYSCAGKPDAETEPSPEWNPDE